MTDAKAEEAKRLSEMVYGGSSPKICNSPGCYNRPKRGYVVCVACLSGEAELADPDVVANKKRLEKLLR
jgi:hypothetical protein